MTEKEKIYIAKFGKEFLTLREASKIWIKPSYSSLSKILPTIGYQTAVEKNIIPPYQKVGNTYIFRINHILDFIEKKFNTNDLYKE